MHEIKVPRESANDNDVAIVSINYCDGDWVAKDSIVASVEGEKAVYDIVSEMSGYIYFLVSKLERREINSVIAVLADVPASDPIEIKNKYTLTEKKNPVIETNGDSRLDRRSCVNEPMTGLLRVAVIGAGLGLDQILDAAIDNKKIRITSAYDDIKFKLNMSYSGVPIIGGVDINKIQEDYSNRIFDALLISISTNIKFRKACFDALYPEIPFVNLIHRSAVVSPNSKIGLGNIILANTVIGSDVRLGNNNFISTMCNIEHHCRVGSHCTFGPGVVFSGGVEVCDEVKFGTGIFVEPFYVFNEKQFVKSGSVIT